MFNFSSEKVCYFSNVSIQGKNSCREKMTKNCSICLKEEALQTLWELVEPSIYPYVISFEIKLNFPSIKFLKHLNRFISINLFWHKIFFQISMFCFAINVYIYWVLIIPRIIIIIIIIIIVITLLRFFLHQHYLISFGILDKYHIERIVAEKNSAIISLVYRFFENLLYWLLMNDNF